MEKKTQESFTLKPLVQHFRSDLHSDPWTLMCSDPSQLTEKWGESTNVAIGGEI